MQFRVTCFHNISEQDQLAATYPSASSGVSAFITERNLLYLFQNKLRVQRKENEAFLHGKFNGSYLSHELNVEAPYTNFGPILRLLFPRFYDPRKWMSLYNKMASWFLIAISTRRRCART